MSDTESNPYESPGAAGVETQPRRSVLDLALTIITLLALGALLASVVASQKVFRPLFADFEVTIGLLSRAALHGTVPLLIFVVLVPTIAKEWLLSPRTAQAWNLVIVAVVVLFGVVYWMALLLPLVETIQSLS